MPPKKVSKEDSRLGRKTRQNEIRDKSSLANVSTPVGQRAHESIPEEEDHETPPDLSPVRENLVTEAASKRIDRQQESSDSSDNSDLEGTRLNPTTVKKSAEVTSPTLTSIPFNINMVDFDTELLIVVEKWLGGSRINSDIRQMLIVNQ